LKEEVSELKKLFEKKEVGSQFSTPVKGIDRPNNGRWKGKKDNHKSPVHTPEKDWWKGRKKKWYRPVWCDTHGLGGHTTSTCWSKKKKIWRVKEVKECDLEIGGCAQSEGAVQQLEKIQ